MQCIAFLLYYLSETDPKEIETHGYLLMSLCMSWNMSFGCFQSVLHFHTIDPPLYFLAKTNEICGFIITHLFSAKLQ